LPELRDLENENQKLSTQRQKSVAGVENLGKQNRNNRLQELRDFGKQNRIESI
jgi:hypothetical protein